MVFASLVSTTLLSAVACTKKNEAGLVRISMPASVVTAGTTVEQKGVVTASSDGGSSGGNWNTGLNPTVGADLNCYAIFVSGSSLNTSTCTINDSGTTSTVKFGPFVGLIAQGSETTLEVPTGGDRVFHVVGFRSTSAANCVRNQIPRDFDESLLSEPFVIASQPAAVPPGPSSLIIRPTLNLQRKIVDCRFAGSTGNTGGGSSGSSLSFGNLRDGKLQLQGTSLRELIFGDGVYNSASNLVHVPNPAGVGSSKYFGASRQVSNIDTATGKILTLSGPFTASEFEPGDEILFYVSAGTAMSAPDDPDTGACGSNLFRGRYGTSTIASVAGAAITLTSKFVDDPSKVKNANLTAPLTNSSFCRIAVHRIPNFEEIKVDAGANWTLAPQPYDSESGTGGVLVVRTKRLELNGDINFDASSKGYLGGSAQYSGFSVSGAGGLSSSFANQSGGGSAPGSGSGAGGAGSAQGGGVIGAFGGLPINYCQNSIYESVAVGADYTCGRSNGGVLKCWGNGSFGQLGDGSTSGRYVPSHVATAKKFDFVSTGTSHTCAIEQGTGRLFCWGLNNFGQLGDGSTIDRGTPVAVDPATSYKEVAVALNSTCGLTTSGLVRCWGSGASGQIGNGSTSNSPTPITIDGAVSYASISAGKQSVCGVTVSGALKCWGSNIAGKLGDGTTTNRTSPVEIAASGYKSVSVGAGNTTCATTTTDIARCWGENTFSQIGDGTSTDRLTPTLVSGAIPFTRIAVGSRHVCGLANDQRLYCWGDNTVGTLGDATSVTRSTPTLIDAAARYTHIAAALSNTCGISDGGQLKCWGSNMSGQIGIGSFNAGVLIPTNVRTQNTCLAFADQKVFAGGGGGGSGSTHAGASGGGLVLIYAKEISGSGSLTFSASGGDGFGTTSAAGSGGGGGGTVALATRAYNHSTANFLANGGGGYFSGVSNSAGGGGGSVEVKTCAAESVGFAATQFNVNGGAGFAGSDYGAYGRLDISDTVTTCGID